MEKNKLIVRELQEKDIISVTEYWMNAAPEYLTSLGVDLAIMPSKDQLITALKSQLLLPYAEKKAYALIWELDGEPIGHSNVNPLVYGKEASMHLHIWDEANRKRGFGTEFVKISLPFYFKNLCLTKIYSEPYAYNSSPNKTLERAGFMLVSEYITTPGAITFEQPVKRWEILSDKIM